MDSRGVRVHLPAGARDRTLGELGDDGTIDLRQRRRFHRVSCSLELCLESMKPTRKVTVLCENVSAGGLGVLATIELPLGTRVSTMLPFSTGAVRVVGRVVRVSPYTGDSPGIVSIVGISLHHADERALDMLVRLVMELERKRIALGDGGNVAAAQKST